jgi:hypothetical protein
VASIQRTKHQGKRWRMYSRTQSSSASTGAQLPANRFQADGTAAEGVKIKSLSGTRRAAGRGTGALRLGGATVSSRARREDHCEQIVVGKLAQGGGIEVDDLVHVNVRAQPERLAFQIDLSEVAGLENEFSAAEPP